jgi:hypothetical protein
LYGLAQGDRVLTLSPRAARIDAASRAPERRRVAGGRVGLITNHTAIAADRRYIIDVLSNAGVKLLTPFGPEQGIRGGHNETFKVTSRTEPATGMPIHRLFFSVQRPTPEMLEGEIELRLRYSGCPSTLRHLHHDDDILHGGSGMGGYPRHRPLPAESDHCVPRRGTRARSGFCKLLVRPGRPPHTFHPLRGGKVAVQAAMYTRLAEEKFPPLGTVFDREQIR